MATIQCAIDLGETHFDTAEAYDFYKIREQIGRVVRGRRGGLILATMFAFEISDDETTSTIAGFWCMPDSHARVP